jgi:hypothetical protein
MGINSGVRTSRPLVLIYFLGNGETVAFQYINVKVQNCLIERR